MSNQRKMIGVIGGHSHNTTSKAQELSEKIGYQVASAGYTVLTGGEDGIMESVCKGAKKAGGATIAIMKGNKKSDANPYIDYVIPTSLDLAFMNVLIWSSDCILAFTGRYGTLSELGLILDIGKPLIMIGPNELINTEAITRNNFRHFKDVRTDEEISNIVIEIERVMQE